jgi:hypothetical protein
LSFATDLKILTDELISLNYILHFNSQHNTWPDEIEIDSIGTYLKLKNTDGFEPFNKHKDTVKKLNQSVMQ